MATHSFARNKVDRIYIWDISQIWSLFKEWCIYDRWTLVGLINYFC
uniref:Uncharacterized protein n=1 Tax=Anguilla anguilla TaxID=7936 RepID=A0A0E9RLE7_ANGAN